jgi:hypothetical protein
MKCHGNLNSGKMSPRQGQTLFLEDIAVDTFVHSSFGTVVMPLFQGFFSTPSWHTCTYLACGWAVASDRHPITPYMWLTGATAVKHFARVSVFRGGPLSHQRHRRQHVACGPGRCPHAVVHGPRGSRHGDTAVPLPALVQTESGTPSTRRRGGLAGGAP